MLFYSLPCLFGILPDDQYHHFSLIVFSIFILLKEDISSRELTKCRQMILEFVINIPGLYQERYSTSNVHLLLHLADKVEDLGPLWSSSCFYFEDFNGQLRHLFHGTQKIECQIASAVGVHQSFPRLARFLRHGTCEMDLFQKMTEKKVQKINEFVSDGLYVVGAYFRRSSTSAEEEAIISVVGNVHSSFSNVCTKATK